MTLGSGKKSGALNLARSKTLADKLAWLVQSDRQDIPTTRAQMANLQPSAVHLDTATKR